MNDLKYLTRIFKALANLSRLKIIQLLKQGKEMAVTDIAIKIHVTVTGTSKHLIHLEKMDILERSGRAGQVFYSLNKNMDQNIHSILNKFLN